MANYSYTRKKNKKSVLWVRLILGILVLLSAFFLLRSSYKAKVDYPAGTRIEITKGAGFSKFYTHLSAWQRWMMKLWIKNNTDIIPKLQEWTYYLSWSYSKDELMKLIAQGPEIQQQKVTLLESWSMYDIDQYLANQGLITAWSYIQKAQNQDFISKMRSEFSFLVILPEGKSLEGFLYPDTYFLDIEKDITEQLIKSQLKNREKRVWSIYRDQFLTFTPQWVDLTQYRALILASVIENEEKSRANKPLIAWIFINRLLAGMRLDADVTLCYGLAIPYSQCRAAIPLHLSDTTNLYNTRQNIGLMPTPISSPSVETLDALFNYQQTKALFYLHDNQGRIHYWATLDEHNQNKMQYLNQ